MAHFLAINIRCTRVAKKLRVMTIVKKIWKIFSILCFIPAWSKFRKYTINCYVFFLSSLFLFPNTTMDSWQIYGTTKEGKGKKSKTSEKGTTNRWYKNCFTRFRITATYLIRNILLPQDTNYYFLACFFPFLNGYSHKTNEDPAKNSNRPFPRLTFLFEFF